MSTAKHAARHCGFHSMTIPNMINIIKIKLMHLLLSLKKQLSASLSAARLVQATSPPPSRTESREECTALSADERRALEDRAQAVKADLEARKNNITELRKRLEKTHVTE